MKAAHGYNDFLGSFSPLAPAHFLHRPDLDRVELKLANGAEQTDDDVGLVRF